MAVYIINNGSRLLKNLVHLLAPYNPKLVNRDDLALLKPTKDDLLVLSGGHEIPIQWHKKEYGAELRLIKNHKGPIIGICLGFELITRAFGSHLHQLDKREHRILKLYNTKASNIIPDKVKINVFEAHTWATLHVEKPLTALAFSKEGIEIIKHATKPIYGLQFHPEYEEGNNGKIIFDKILKEIYLKK